MNLPWLPRLVPHHILQSDKEIWQPGWKCFCCSDTGIVNQNLTTLVIPNYNPHIDPLVVCRRLECAAGLDFRADERYDQRFTAPICAELDRIHRRNWKVTVDSQFELITQRIAETTAERSMRKRVRTCVEQAEAQRRHEEIISAAPGQLRAMARVYLGDEWMEDDPV